MEKTVMDAKGKTQYFESDTKYKVRRDVAKVLKSVADSKRIPGKSSWSNS